MDEQEKANRDTALYLALIALKYYGAQKYSHTMGLSPDVQFVAEDALAKIKKLLEHDDYFRSIQGLIEW